MGKGISALSLLGIITVHYVNLCPMRLPLTTYPQDPERKRYYISSFLEKREPSYTVGGNVNWYSHYGKQYGGSLKN